MTVLAAYAATQMFAAWSGYRSARKGRHEQPAPIPTFAKRPGHLGFEAFVFPPPS